MSTRADVIVVGAGSTGAAASAFLAERGLRVICLEQRPLDSAGARWVNGVPRAAFVAAGVELPGAGESDGRPAPFHLVAPSGRALVATHDVIDVDMRKLVARLQHRARSAGAELRGEVRVTGWDGDRLATSSGVMHARWVVDASGLAGAKLLGQPAVARQHLCAAAQEVRAVVDRPAAEAFFARHGVAIGEVLGLVGVAGGYSVLNLRLHHGAETMGILTGTIPTRGVVSGKALLDTFVREHAWVGPRVFGGSGAIPLRRAYDRLADDRVALLGDAACQVFPAHGSGVGAGLVAARLLADTLGRGGSLRDYEVAWQRQHGGVFAFFDVFRRWNQSVDGDTLGRMMSLGLVDPESLRAGIDQVLPQPSARTILDKTRVLLRELRWPAGWRASSRAAPRFAGPTRVIRRSPSTYLRGDAASTGCSASRHTLVASELLASGRQGLPSRQDLPTPLRQDVPCGHPEAGGERFQRGTRLAEAAGMPSAARSSDVRRNTLIARRCGAIGVLIALSGCGNVTVKASADAGIDSPSGSVCKFDVGTFDTACVFAP